MSMTTSPTTRVIDTKIIDGKAFASRLTDYIVEEVAAMKASARQTPGLAVVLVGDDPASHVYVRSKGRQTIAVGMQSFVYHLPASTPEVELIALIRTLNANAEVDGILVQLPLPPHMDAARVIDTIDPAKDVDGFHVVNVGRLCAGLDSFVPCTPQGCMMMLKEHIGDLSGLRAVIVGRSNIVGKPMAQLLLQENCTVTIAHSRTHNLADECRKADILIAAVGHAGLIKGDWIKPGATVVDVGINRVIDADGKTRLVGDVDFEAALGVAGRITPVPGGVGPMTIACLLRNTLMAAKARTANADVPAQESRNVSGL